MLLKQTILLGKLLYCMFTCIMVRILNNKIYVCLSVDCDGHGYKRSISEGHKILFHLYNRLSLRGKITYFVNEKYEYTKKHSDILREILRRGDRIELHVHSEKRILLDDIESLKNEIQSECKALYKFCNEENDDYKLKIFRSGSHVYSNTLFEVLKDIGICYDSTILIGQESKVSDHFFNNTKLPVNCYFMDFKNLPYSYPQRSELVQIPIWQHLPNLIKIKRNVRKGEPVIITTLIHPFNMFDDKINHIRCYIYKLCILCMRLITGVEFTTLELAITKWEKWWNVVEENTNTIITKEHLHKLASLKYSAHKLSDDDLNFFKEKDMLNNNHKLTKNGNDFAYAAQEFIQLDSEEMSEVFKVIDVLNKKVLDVGCCGGAYSFKAIELGAREVFGIDTNQNYILMAQTIKSQRNVEGVTFTLTDAENLAGVNGTFDTVICRLVLPYIDADKFISSLTDKTKIGTTIFIKNHTMMFYYSKIKETIRNFNFMSTSRCVFAVINGFIYNYFNYKTSIKIRDMYYKDVFYTKRTLCRILNEHGWHVLEDNWVENSRTPYMLAVRIR